MLRLHELVPLTTKPEIATSDMDKHYSCPVPLFTLFPRRIEVGPKCRVGAQGRIIHPWELGSASLVDIEASCEGAGRKDGNQVGCEEVARSLLWCGSRRGASRNRRELSVTLALVSRPLVTRGSSPAWAGEGACGAEGDTQGSKSRRRPSLRKPQGRNHPH